MTDEQVDDLKQFITVTVRNEVRNEIAHLRKEMHAGFAGVAEIITLHIDDSDEQRTSDRSRISKLEKRVTKLETNAA